VTLPARQSPTGAAIRLDSAGLADAVHQLLMMSASTAAYLPLLIHTLATARSKRAAVAMIVRQLMAAGLVSSGRNAVIGYPIRCAEPWARLRQAGEQARQHGAAAEFRVGPWSAACGRKP
jgi:hypothetical protein